MSTPPLNHLLEAAGATQQSAFTTRRVNTLFMLALLILVLVAVASLLTLRRYKEIEEVRIRGREAMLHLNRVLTGLLNVETAARGYALTGRERFLEPYEISIAQIRRDLPMVSALTVASEAQRARVEQLHAAVDTRLALAQKLIQYRRELQGGTPVNLEIAEEGKRVMDTTRVLIGEMVAEENRAMAEHEVEVRAREIHTMVSIVVAVGLAGALMSAAFLLYSREHKERVRAEGFLRESNTALAAALKRAESADRLKSIFLATMSHELRTPLNSIIGFTGLMKQGLAGPVTPEQKKQLSIVSDSAKHLLSLINEVLDFSKLEAGQVELHYTSVEVSTVVQRAVDSMTLLAAEKGLTLRTELQWSGVLLTDAKRLEQIILNLVSNAVKFTDQGQVVVRVQHTGSHINFEVEDTGIGIAAADLPRLFTPFQQLDDSTERAHEGSGLGLSIAQRLAKMLGGRIDMETELGKGSKFRLCLPANAQARLLTEEKHADESPSHK